MTQLVCGTGGWGGPKPGDPDNNVILTAKPAFGGIDVSWSYPGINPHAVAHTLLYRSTSGTEADPTLYHVVSGNFFYDRITSATPIEYFYWIRIVSVNGTIGELIGPASSYARPLIAEVIEQLTGEIDAGMLAQSLKTEIERIRLNTLGITQEMIDRAASDEALGVAFNEVAAYSDETRALLQQEVLAQVSANEAFVAAVDTLYAEMGDSLAAIQTIQKAIAREQESLASHVTTVQSSLGNQISSVQVGLQTNINEVSKGVYELGALYTAKVDVNGLIGGFGVHNDGKTVEAGFDVDRFWIGRTRNKRKPFIIENNEVFIDEAAINKLTFSKLRDESGSFIVRNGKVQAKYLTVDSASIADASITSAKIRDAAINTAKIGNAAVDTLRIAGNAVTVPKFASGGSVIGNGSDRDAVSIWFDVPAGSWLYATTGGSIGYNRDQGGHVSTSLVIGGQVVSYTGSHYYYQTALHSGAVYFSTARSVSVTLRFNADSKVGLTYSSIFAMVVKR